MQKCLYCTSNNSPPSRKRCHTFLRECPSARACSISGSARRINPVFVVGASVLRALIGAIASSQLSLTVTIPPFSPQKNYKKLHDRCISLCPAHNKPQTTSQSQRKILQVAYK